VVTWFYSFDTSNKKVKSRTLVSKKGLKAQPLVHTEHPPISSISQHVPALNTFVNKQK